MAVTVATCTGSTAGCGHHARARRQTTAAAEAAATRLAPADCPHCDGPVVLATQTAARSASGVVWRFGEG